MRSGFPRHLPRRGEPVYARFVFHAGVPVDDKLVLTLAGKLRDAGLDDSAGKLETAYDRETKVLALEIGERDEILQVLVDYPEGLGELRALLLQQQVWRTREGIS
jgi:hypothetical protein